MKNYTMTVGTEHQNGEPKPQTREAVEVLLADMNIPIKQTMIALDAGVAKKFQDPHTELIITFRKEF